MSFHEFWIFNFVFLKKMLWLFSVHGILHNSYCILNLQSCVGEKPLFLKAFIIFFALLLLTKSYFFSIIIWVEFCVFVLTYETSSDNCWILLLFYEPSFCVSILMTLTKTKSVFFFIIIIQLTSELTYLPRYFNHSWIKYYQTGPTLESTKEFIHSLNCQTVGPLIGLTGSLTMLYKNSAK